MEHPVKTIKKILPSKTLKSVGLSMIVVGVLLGSFAAPFVPSVYAQEAGGTLEDPIERTVPVCEIENLGGCFPSAAYSIYSLTAWIMSVAGEFFDRILAFSLDKETIDTKFANKGWELTRDLANIGFIFILLYLSFLTILQLGGGNVRSLVVRLIIVALLINFSLFFTKVVIDSSNILALGFYNNIQVTTVITTEGADGKPGEIIESGRLGDLIQIGGQKSISLALAQSVKPQSLIDTNSFIEWAKNDTDQGGNGNVMLAIVFLSSAVVNIFLAYTFFVVGLLFLLRVGGLWFVMIGAPVAFLAWIVPGKIIDGKSGNFANKWWKFLLAQSFLAPLFLFFLFLIMKFIAGAGEIDKILVPISNLAGTGITERIFSVFIKTAIIVMVLNYALKITKGLSSDAANAVVTRATGAAKFATGAAFGAAGMALTPARLLARGVAAKGAETFLESKGGVATTFKRIPGLARGVGTIGAAGRADVATAEKKYGSLSDSAVRSAGTAVGVSSADRKAAIRVLAKRKNLKPDEASGFTAEHIETEIGGMEKQGFTKEEMKAIEAARWQYVDIKKLTTERPGDKYGADEISKAITKLVKSIKPDAIEDGLSAEFFTTPEILDEMIKTFSGKHMEKMKEQVSVKYRDKEGEINPTNVFVERLEEMVNEGQEQKRARGEIETKEVSDKLKDVNKNLSEWLSSPSGSNTLTSRGFKASEKKNKEEKEDSSIGETTKRFVDEGL